MHENNPIYNSLKTNQTHQSKLNKGCEWPLQRDGGRLQKVERSSVLIDW
jgi:hypothetical protein